MNPEKWQALLELEERGEACTYPDMYSVTKLFFQNVALAAFPPDKYPKLLVLGCGCGIEVQILRELGYGTVGITMAQADVDYAKSQLGVDILKMDMHDLDFPPAHFDCAIARQSLEHAYSPLLVMMETRVVLRMGGRWFIDLPSPHNKDMWGMNHRGILYPTQMRYYFKLCGFQILEAQESKNQTLGYNGGGDPYRYVVEKSDLGDSSHRQVIEKLEELHRP